MVLKIVEGYKVCNNCGVSKPLDEYWKKKRTNGEMRPEGQCKDCVREKRGWTKRRGMILKKDLPTKICSHCKVEKDKSEFHKLTSHSDGLQGYCKECSKRIVVDNRRANRNKRRQKLLSQGIIPYTQYRLGRLQRTIVAILQEFTKSQAGNYPNTGYIHRGELALTTAELHRSGSIKNWGRLVKDFLKRQAILDQEATAKTDKEIVKLAKRILAYRKISENWFAPEFYTGFSVSLKTLSNKGLIDLKDGKLVGLTEIGKKLKVNIRVSKAKTGRLSACKNLDKAFAL